MSARLRPMTPRSLTLVLPAFNEAERIGPALDELFGYLRRRGEAARDGAPGSATCPTGSTSSSSTTAHRRHGRPRPRSPGGRSATAASDRPDLERDHRPPRRQGRRGPGRDARTPRSDLVVFADADMATPPDMIPLLVEALADHDVALGSRIQPDGSDMRKSQPRLPPAPRQGVPPARVDLGRRPGQGHPVRLQGLHPRGRPRPVRAAAGPRASCSTSS